jgi:hypothetical protein
LEDIATLLEYLSGNKLTRNFLEEGNLFFLRSFKNLGKEKISHA